VIGLSFLLSLTVLGVLLYTAQTEALGVNEGITNSESLLLRAQDWESILERYLFEGGTLGILFGYALTTSEVFSYPIDNYYLGLFLFGGVVGLVLWMVFFIWTFSVVVKQAQVTNHPMWLALASYLFAFTIGANYQNILNIYAFLVMVFLLFHGSREKPDRVFHQADTRLRASA
jgi:hypothetical protein